MSDQQDASATPLDVVERLRERADFYDKQGNLTQFYGPLSRKLDLEASNGTGGQNV